jgi:hypothetical protein
MGELQILQKRLEDERSTENIIICTIEELSEVTQVLTKYLRNSSKFSINRLTEEVAHSTMMLDAIIHTFRLDDTTINSEKIEALRRCFDIK